MTKFQEILDAYKDKICGGVSKIRLNPYALCIETIKIEETPTYKQLSLNDLLSPESGFLQACKWDNKSMLLLQYNGIDIIFHRNYEDREYHAMMLSILSQEEKIKYLEDNIIIDE